MTYPNRLRVGEKFPGNPYTVYLSIGNSLLSVDMISIQDLLAIDAVSNIFPFREINNIRNLVRGIAQQNRVNIRTLHNTLLHQGYNTTLPKLANFIQQAYNQLNYQ